MPILYKHSGFGEKIKVDLTLLGSRNTYLSSESWGMARTVGQKPLEFDRYQPSLLSIFSYLENDLVSVLKILNLDQ